MPGRGALWGQDDHLLPRASRGTSSHNCLSLKTEDPFNYLEPSQTPRTVRLIHILTNSKLRKKFDFEVHQNWEKVQVLQNQVASSQLRKMLILRYFKIKVCNQCFHLNVLVYILKPKPYSGSDFMFKTRHVAYQIDLHQGIQSFCLFVFFPINFDLVNVKVQPVYLTFFLLNWSNYDFFITFLES